MTVDSKSKVKITSAIVDWCKFLASPEAILEQSAKSHTGPYSCRNRIGQRPITYVMAGKLEDAGLIVWVDSPERQGYKRAELTVRGYKLTQPSPARLSATARNDKLSVQYTGTVTEGLPYLFRLLDAPDRRSLVIRSCIAHHVNMETDPALDAAIELLHKRAEGKPGTDHVFAAALRLVANLLPRRTPLDKDA